MKILNKSLFLSALAGSIMLMSSCSDSFLDRYSLTEQPLETFWQSSTDAQLALTACYDALQDKYLYNGSTSDLGPLYMDCISDNGGHFNWSGWVPGYDVAMGIHNPSSIIFSNYWKASYEVIKRCNFFLCNVDKVPNMDEKLKKSMIAEAITLRALIYTNLTITFQDVPYLTETLTMETSQQPKKSRNEIVDNVLKDLKSCVNDLPEPDKVERGKVTRSACYAIMGRLAMYNNMWDEAISAYREVMKFGYQIDPSYSTLFTQEGETSKEIILAVRYEGPGLGEGAGFNGHYNTPSAALNGTINLADDYYIKATGKKTTDTNYGEIKDGRLLPDKPNPDHYLDRDPRLYLTLFVPGMKWNGKGGPGKWYGGAAASLSTVYVMKYFNPKDTKNSFDNGQDFYVIRYAEVLLSLAEALVQKGGYDENEVIGLINRIRQRQDVMMPKVEDVEGVGLSKDELLEIIKHERRVELAFEGLRLFDLYRWKELDKAVGRVENERISLGLAYEKRQFNGERDYVWPVPTGEVDTSKKLEQHPLWK
jgi:hypothetical protein